MNERIKLPTPEQILSELPLDVELQAKIAGHREEIKKILDGRSGRMIMIAGPCSAWPSEAVLEYAEGLAKVAQEVRDKIMIVMRGYIQKPRTTVGWPGPLVQPDPYEPPDIARGIRYCRKMLLEVGRMGLPVADEMLFTHNGGYFDDVLSYLAVGARSAEDSEHRYITSSLDMPVGIKNPTSGNTKIGVNSLVSAQSGHTFAHSGNQVTSSGNPYAHLILRGGENGPNYSTEAIEDAAMMMTRKKLVNPAIIVDASHDNAKTSTGEKDCRMQVEVVARTLTSMKESELVRKYLKGWMVESFLEAGKQDTAKVPKDKLVYGLSITDPCINLDLLEGQLQGMYKRM
jgi:3-deoxy-7-phosphoheptulonate synthase